MDLAVIAFFKIVVMFIILALGIVSYKTGLISKEGNGSLSNLLLMVVNPCLIYMSFQQEYSEALMHKLLLAFAFSILVHIIAIAASSVIFKKSIKDYEVERLASVYSNCGFIGIPIISALFGQEGVFYLSSYIAIFNLFLWTHGVIVTTGKCDRKMVLDTIKNPTIIAFVLGVASYIARFSVPSVLGEAMNFMSDLNTPLAMIIAGVTIAQDRFLPALKNKRVYFIAALRLLALPIVCAAVLLLFRQDNLVTMVIAVAFACPTAASGTLFAIRFGKNAIYASQNYLISTLLSIITMPIVIIIAQKLAQVIG